MLIALRHIYVHIVTQFLMLVRESLPSTFSHMDRNVNLFVNVGTNHTHHPTGVPHLEGMVGGMTLDRVSGFATSS